jgi:hypothetical protein
MKKLKLKRLTLDELAEVMPIIEKKEQQECVGGENPYTWALPQPQVSPPSADISCAIPGVADVFRGLRDSSTVNLKNLTGTSYEFHRRDFQVYIGGDTINVRALDAVALSHHIINTNPAWSLQTNNVTFDVWKFGYISGSNIPALYISIDSRDRDKMQRLIDHK